jgi:glucose-1-phosphate thymidylyltransferase
VYLSKKQLRLEKLGRGFAWLDTGTPDALLQAANFVHTIEVRQGLQIACPEEIAYQHGWITGAQLEQLASALIKTAYGQYLMSLLQGLPSA